MPKLAKVSDDYENFKEWLTDIKKATPKLGNAEGQGLSKIKRQSMEITLLEKYGNVSDWIVHTAMKMDREHLMEVFCGDDGLRTVGSFKTSVDSVKFETEKYKNDPRIDRLLKALDGLEEVVQDIVGAQEYKEKLQTLKAQTMEKKDGEARLEAEKEAEHEKQGQIAKGSNADNHIPQYTSEYFEKINSCWIVVNYARTRGMFDGRYERDPKTNLLMLKEKSKSKADTYNLDKDKVASHDVALGVYWPDDQICWMLAEVDKKGTHSPVWEKQPVIDALEGSHCSADSKFIIFIETDEVDGKQEWTLIEQLYTTKGPRTPEIAASKPYDPNDPELNEIDFLNSRIVNVNICFEEESYQRAVDERDARVMELEANRRIEIRQQAQCPLSPCAPVRDYTTPAKFDLAKTLSECRNIPWREWKVSAVEENFAQYNGTYKLGSNKSLPDFVCLNEPRSGVKPETPIVIQRYPVDRTGERAIKDTERKKDLCNGNGPTGSWLWVIAEWSGDSGYNPKQDNQPVVERFYGTGISENSRFVLFLEKEDPTGRNKWTRATQYFGRDGLLSAKMDKKYKSVRRDKVKKFKPWDSYLVEYFVDFEEFVLDVEPKALNDSSPPEKKKKGKDGKKKKA